MSVMRIAIRRVGNSLGVILPKSALDSWGLGEGDFLELTERSLRPRASSTLSVEILDEHKRKLAVAVASLFTPNLIRAHSLGNLHRWRSNDVWVTAYDEWKEIMETSNDGELFAVMLGRDEHANRLRQSPPYVGLLPREVVKRLNEEAAG
jgi:antitoxin component of MazEF toxin-antitoxin module